MSRVSSMHDRQRMYDALKMAQRAPSEDFEFLVGARIMPSSGFYEAMRIMGMAPAPRMKTERELAIEELEADCGPTPNAWEWTV